MVAPPRPRVPLASAGARRSRRHPRPRRRVLLGLRRGALAGGTWSVAGGKPDPGESPVETARRELREETGLEGANPRLAGESVDELDDGELWHTVFVELDWVGGEPQEREAEKLGDWGWYGWEALPEPLFAPVASLARRRP